jgi:hypothetical protein
MIKFNKENGFLPMAPIIRENLKIINLMGKELGIYIMGVIYQGSINKLSFRTKTQMTPKSMLN